MTHPLSFDGKYYLRVSLVFARIINWVCRKSSLKYVKIRVIRGDKIIIPAEAPGSVCPRPDTASRRCRFHR